jgi:hypothetical protein
MGHLRTQIRLITSVGLKKMAPKRLCYIANLAVVTATLLLARWYVRLPWLLVALVFIVSLIFVNLILWYSLRLRARAALATDQTSAKPKISRRTRTLQFILIGGGLFVLAVNTVFGSFDKAKILDVLCALFAIGYGAILGIKKKQSS